MQTGLSNAFQEAGVVCAYLFGSRAQGRESPKSDWDVAVLYAPGTSALQRFDANCLLQRRLESLLPGAVDLISLNDAGPVLQFESVIRGKLWFPDDPVQMLPFESKVRQRYEDYCWSQRFFTEERRRRLGLKFP